MLTPVSIAADLQEEDEEEFHKCGRTLPKLLCLSHPYEGCTATVGIALQSTLLLFNRMQRLDDMQAVSTAILLLTLGHSM